MPSIDEVTSFSIALGFLASTLRLATPLIFAALGGYTSERSGTINIALEGLCLMGAFAAAAAAHIFHSPWIGVSVGVAVATALASVHGLLCITLGANQIISGIAINFLALGLPPVISKALFDFSGGTPQLSSAECLPKTFLGSPLMWLALVTAGAMTLMHKYHRLGQYFRFAGEHPEALQSQGISVRAVRWKGILLSGALCGLAGSYLSIDHGTAFSRNMTAGRGFIALAALIAGRWNPLGATLAALLFGLIEASQILLQGVTLPGGQVIPVQWIQIIPYAATIFILATRWKSGRQAETGSYAPKSLGQAF